MDHTTAAAHLRALRDEDDPLIDLIENDRDLAGDLYQLRIPDEIADRASRVAWRPGQLHALRPVFRELGHPAAFVYEALEQAKGPQRSFDLTATTGLSRRAVYEALETLAAWHLVKPVDGRWRLVPGTSLQLLASSSAAWRRSAPRSAGTAANGPPTGGHCGSSINTPSSPPRSARSRRPRRTCGHPNRPPRTGKP